MSADWTLIFPAVTGLALTVQGAASGQLAKYLGRGVAGVWTVTSSIVVGVFVWVIESRGGQGIDFGLARSETPWWAYLGGLLGSIYVVSMTSLIQRLGAAAFFLVCVLFQLGTGAIMDHFGLFNLPVQPTSAGKIAGLLVAGVGVGLVTFGWDGVVKAFRERRLKVKTTRKGGDDTLSSEAVRDDLEKGGFMISRGDERVESPAESVTSSVTDDDMRDSPSPPSPPPADVRTEESETAGLSSLDVTRSVSRTSPPAVNTTTALTDPAILIAAVAGVCVSFQTGMNGAMGKTAYGPGFATLFSLVTANVGMIGFMVLDALILWKRIDVSRYREIPWYAWFSGVLGFTYVMCVTYLTPRLGAANLLGVNIALQVCSALLFDHYGWLGFAERRMTAAKLAGAGLVVAGVVMLTLLR
ncbi:hypothetical protein HDU67_005379 [Dinochytrium kinnereticum]|nr:hypothetical protein HDU67_005379 [Dinochytrium kinnereticum]